MDFIATVLFGVSLTMIIILALIIVSMVETEMSYDAEDSDDGSQQDSSNSRKN